MPIVSNKEFLTALFADDAPWTHVTDFPYDPGNIPKDRHLSAWKGDYFQRYRFGEQTNQYFTISHFYEDDLGIARRRKALYRHTRVIVLDDVKEKLSMEEVNKLPRPAWILETSPGSQQWGYILNEPCTERARVENLLDGLVANGLAPDGRDPGMKGVTRYVRLPEGINNKASKLVDGQPFKCQMVLWEPFNTVTLEQLAAPFHVDLDAVRREGRVDGAADVGDHPLLSVDDIITVKEVRSDGRFDITCPWVDEHTGADDSGSAIFTNEDSTIGFKCHHGACQSRTGADLLRYVEGQKPGFGAEFANWKVMRSFSQITDLPAVTFDAPTNTPNATAPAMAPPVSPVMAEKQPGAFDQLINAIRMEPPVSEKSRMMSAEFLKAVDELPEMDKVHWHNELTMTMRWTKSELSNILKDLRAGWYINKREDLNFYNDVVYIGELNQFFDRRKRIFYTPEAYNNVYSHLDSEARKEALQGGRVTKVDRVDYAPKQPAVFTERGVTFANSWTSDNEPQGAKGDACAWLDHFTTLGWGDSADHMLKWMAFTIMNPQTKINHVLLLGSGEGCGKDWLMYPLVKAMNDHSTTISGEELLDGFNDYLLSTKHLHVNETELGDRKEAAAVAARLKPLAAAPPDKLRVNQKGIKQVQVRNIVNVSMTTNSQLPFRLNGPSRRFYPVWSDLQTRDENGNMMPQWKKFWKEAWHWMRNGGAEACIWYLRNCVDLSNFDPGEAPPVTEFLRDIQEASKSPMQQTIEAFIQARAGAFYSDIVSVHDMSMTLMNAEMHPDHAILAYHDPKWFTPIRVGNIMKDILNVSKRSAKRGHNHARVWVIRNQHKYQGVGTAELHDEYDEQLQQARTAVRMKVVNN